MLGSVPHYLGLRKAPFSVSDSTIPVLSTRARRKSADAATAPAITDIGASATPVAIWEQLARRTQLALIVFDERNALRVISPTVSRMLGDLPPELLGEPASVTLSGLRLVSAAQTELASAVLFPASHIEPVLRVEIPAKGNAQYSVYAFPVSFEGDSPIGRALLFEPINAALVGQMSDELESFLAQNSLQIEDAAHYLRQRTKRADIEVFRQLAETILAASTVSRRAIEDARTLRRAQSASLRLHMAPTELGDLMMELMAQWQQAAPSYLFELALPGALPIMSVDPDRIRQALSSLLHVAVAASAPGDTIRVTLRPQNEDLMITIRTNRGKFPKETVDSLLSPFQHLSLSPDVTVNLGLELPSAQALIALHGGSLRVESAEPEAGLLMHAMLPRVPTYIDQPLPLKDLPEIAPTPGPKVTNPRHGAVVLIALRDQRMARYLRANIDAHGYRCYVAADAQEAERRIDLEDPDVILLDTSLSDSQPEDILRRLRSLASAEFVMLTPAHDPAECARLLDLGAADYLVVPLSLDELLARMRVILRSHERAVRATQPERVFRSGDLLIDFERRIVTIDERPVMLSKTEYKLLRALAEHAGMVLSHDMLLSRVWGPGYGQEVEFAWVYVRRLRKKIEVDPGHPQYIITVPGVGYKLVKV